ncbi:NUDIX domain-containing protein [Fodinicola acaciae]|uniref:NUDIX domain-containing protein n=1 Tax=Fodinicola acaciae TaxID=2681555 RepID=UPI001C9E76B7
MRRHPSRRRDPECWDLVGGHVEPGELPRQAVSRECLEEVGSTSTTLVPVPMMINYPALDVHGFLVTRWCHALGRRTCQRRARRARRCSLVPARRSRGPEDGPPGRRVEHPERRPGRNRLTATKPLARRPERAVGRVPAFSGQMSVSLCAVHPTGSEP